MTSTAWPGDAATPGSQSAASLPGRWPCSLDSMLTVSCSTGASRDTILTLAGELDAASTDPAYRHVRDTIDTCGGPVLLDVAGLSFCDARGLGALLRMSSHARQAGSSLQLLTPPPRLVKLITITGLARRPGNLAHDSADCRQRAARDAVVVTAQQQVRLPWPGLRRRHNDAHDRPGRTATGTIGPDGRRAQREAAGCELSRGVTMAG